MNRKRPYLGAFLITPALEHGLSLRRKLFTAVMNIVSYGIGGESKACVGWTPERRGIARCAGGCAFAAGGLRHAVALCAAGGEEKGLAFGKWVVCPAGTEAISLFVIWAACAAGGEGAC